MTAPRSRRAAPQFQHEFQALAVFCLCCSLPLSAPSAAAAAAAALTCNQPAPASGDYVRCGANPLARASTFHNDSGLYEVSIGDPDVQYDAPSGRWLAFWSTGLQTTYTAKNQTMAIKKATSADGVAWAPSLEPVLRTSASPAAWDFSKAETPTVVRLPPALRTPERQWLMLYSGANAAASAGHGAFSADPWYQLGAAFSADGERYFKLPAVESPYYRDRSRGAYANFSVEGLVSCRRDCHFAPPPPCPWRWRESVSKITVSPTLGLVLMGADAFPGLSGVADGLVADPELVVDADGRTLHLFMSSLATDASGSALRYGVSHATSTTGGVSWTPSAANPAINGGAGPSVLRDAVGGGWQLFFLQDSAADKAKVPTTFNPQLGVWAANASGLRGPWVRQTTGPGAGGREVSWCASCGPEKLGWIATGDFAFNAPGGERRWYFVAFDPAPPIPSGWVAPVHRSLRHPLGLEPAVIALSMAHRAAPVKTDEAVRLIKKRQIGDGAAGHYSRLVSLLRDLDLALKTDEDLQKDRSAELWPLAEGNFADPRSISIDGRVFVSGTDYRRLLRFDGDLTNKSRTEFTTTVDFILAGANYGVEVWAWTPYQHSDGSWHAYYTANAFEIMYAQPDPPTQTWTAENPILQWKTVSKLISVKGACYYDSRIQTDETGKLYIITNHPAGPGTNGDVSILALPMASPSQMAPFWATSGSVLLQPDVPKLNSERRDPGFISITENTQIQKIRGTYVLFYSVGDYALPNYKIGLAFSKTLLGPYSKVYKQDKENNWNNTEPMREVQYLMQSSEPAWPGYMNRYLSGPGIGSLVNTTSNGPALLFHARHPNNQGPRYLWLFSYLVLNPGKWDVDDASSLGDLITLGGSCAPRSTSPDPSQCRVKTDDQIKKSSMTFSPPLLISNTSENCGMVPDGFYGLDPDGTHIFGSCQPCPLSGQPTPGKPPQNDGFCPDPIKCSVMRLKYTTNSGRDWDTVNFEPTAIASPGAYYQWSLVPLRGADGKMRYQTWSGIDWYENRNIWTPRSFVGEKTAGIFGVSKAGTLTEFNSEEIVSHAVTITGLPQDINQTKVPGCSFCLPFFYGPILLADGSMLATVVISWAGAPIVPSPDGSWQKMSIITIGSSDGVAWKYLSTMIDAMNTNSTMGPNENDIAVLADGKTLMSAVRMDSDGPCSGGLYTNYHSVFSSDSGLSWGVPSPIAGAGCARPRLHKLAGGPLLMSGGRLCTENTTDLFLWVSWDGMGDEFERHEITHWHNELWKGDPSYKFDIGVNSSKQFETIAYTSMVPAGPGSIYIVYNKYFNSTVDGKPHWPPMPSASFMMRVTFANRSTDAINLKTDDKFPRSWMRHAPGRQHQSAHLLLGLHLDATYDAES